MKIARGKIADHEDYNCPVCDYRVKIPRDAARPKLEDLIAWQSEIPGLPFQPDEEACLDNIVNTAQSFRDFMVPYVSPNPLVSTLEEVPTQRFWLRKIEGADILLAHETNFFRQELHRLVPIAPIPPPFLEVSLSTRKPRPTKQQKLMAQLGLENPDELPQSFKTKAYNVTKRKAQDDAKSHLGRPSLKTSGSSGSLGAAVLMASNSPGGHIQQTSQPPQGQGMHGSNYRPPQSGPGFPAAGAHRRPSQPDSPLFSTAPINLHMTAAANTLTAMQSPFSAGALRDPAIPHNGHLDPSLFSPSIGLDTYPEHHDVENQTLDPHVHDEVHDDGNVELFGNAPSSQSGGNFDSMFADLTNQDDAADAAHHTVDENSKNTDPALLLM